MDPPGKVRDTLLVIAILIATATYQTVLNPPRGVWQDTYWPEDNNSTSSDGIMSSRRIAGQFCSGIFCTGHRQAETLHQPSVNYRKDRRIPLHYAVIEGRKNVTRELLVASPDSAEEVTACGETCLHLAVKNHQFEENLNESNKYDLLNKKDIQGNTVLHLAVSTKQYEAKTGKRKRKQREIKFPLKPPDLTEMVNVDDSNKGESLEQVSQINKRDIIEQKRNSQTDQTHVSNSEDRQVGDYGQSSEIQRNDQNELVIEKGEILSLIAESSSILLVSYYNMHKINNKVNKQANRNRSLSRSKGAHTGSEESRINCIATQETSQNQ
ncbi:hypothetical protein K7X08_008119 [Anisodus acutangulus]|uniref:PGG domain-containing protein n=1 Tax=Anisodus acutangulus TaxID=402998 RepID=A0A9Q1MT32_9SOLA|nr:hypothetical protein K7X08_008119 [Anisodus acutangulus]